ncbi:MAG: hypothetical protein ABSF21_00830 [Dehalococcoidia bacterium]
MPRIYSIVATNATMVTGVNVLVGIYPVATPPAAGSVLIVKRVEISQNANATSVQVRAAMSFRTGGYLTVATVTPTPRKAGGAASAIVGIAGTLAAGKCGITGSADATPAYTDTHVASFNSLNGWLWIPTPNEEIYVTGALAFVVRFLADPATLTGWNCTVNFEELY